MIDPTQKFIDKYGMPDMKNCFLFDIFSQILMGI